MLSRTADHLYWMSRYIERAENVARFIDVNHNLMLDLPGDYAGQWQPIIDTTGDSALFRHPDLAELRDIGAGDPLESFAREKGVTYVKLDGSVGILGNGAGLAMSTVDVVVVAGGRPANFCDLGGGGDAQGVVDALEVIVRDGDVRSIFFNVFGGITR